MRFNLCSIDGPPVHRRSETPGPLLCFLLRSATALLDRHQTALICIYSTHYCKVSQVSSPPLLLDYLLAGFRSGLIFVTLFAGFVR